MMKTFLLLLSFGTFSFVSAQNNELFDINQHLNKINKKNKNKLEKPQHLNPFFGYSRLNGVKRNKSFYLSNGDRVVTLSQDNMPCVVPDMRLFQTMPNLGKTVKSKTSKYGNIPNPAPPFKIEQSLTKK